MISAIFRSDIQYQTHELLDLRHSHFFGMTEPTMSVAMASLEFGWERTCSKNSCSQVSKLPKSGHVAGPDGPGTRKLRIQTHNHNFNSHLTCKLLYSSQPSN